MQNEEINLFPELFGTLELGENGKKWFVLHTKSRCEKKLAKWAHLNEIEYYLPLTDSLKVYAYKKVHFLKVLIPGYFFAKCSLQEKEVLVRAGHVASFLTVINQIEFVEDLKRIYNAKSVSLEIAEVPYIEHGYLVEITSGALIGLRGIIEDIHNPEKIIIRVNVLKKAVSVALSTNQFKVLKKICHEDDEE